MAKNENQRLKPAVLAKDEAKDEAAFNALQMITGYAPNNPAYSLQAITQAFTELRAKQALEDQAVAALATARDEAVNQEWVVHNLILGSKDQIRGQFGKDSLQVQEIGLKRASEYRTRKFNNRPAPEPSKSR
jgi:hypothetical protein